jgi:L-proline---[L-prolyl-carrier protein] ligase
VLDHCRQWLPSYMVPDVLEFREALPRTSTGKVDRVGLALE